MSQILICVGKKVLMSGDGEIIIQAECSDDNFRAWIYTKYSVKVIRIEKQQEYSVVTASHTNEQPNGNLISIPNAINILGDKAATVKEYLRTLQDNSKVQLQYGLRDGRIVCISELSEDERGLKCKCVCPGCGKEIQARLGRQKQRHFAHNGASCNIASAQQTALHILAKEIVEKEKVVLLPGIDVNRADIAFDDDRSYLISYLPASLKYRSATIVQCDKVVLEKHISDIVPDIVISHQNKTCLIEIAVTHFVDDDKKEKAEKIGLPLVEIDISDLYQQEIDRATLKELLLHNQDNRYWIYNPLQKVAAAWAEKEYKRQYEEAGSRVQREEENRLAEVKKKSERQEIAAKKLKKLFSPPIYKKTLATLRDDKQYAESLKTFSFYHDTDGSTPFFIDIPITGEMIFLCDRRVWQGAIFDRFVYNRKTSDEPTTIHIKKIQKWLTDYQKVIKIDWSIAPKTIIHVGEQTWSASLLYDVVKKYLEYLGMIGFLSNTNSQEANIERSHSLCPPSETNAALLEAATESIDKSAPDVDEAIRNIIYPIVGSYRWRNELPTVKLESKSELEQKRRDISQTREAVKIAGYEEVKTKDFTCDQTITDGYGYRWLMCTGCDAIKREDDMASYGGPNRTNIGICRECSRKG